MTMWNRESVNGRDLSEGLLEQPEDEEITSSRDPSDLPINNLDAYKTWCQRVKDEWDGAAQ